MDTKWKKWINSGLIAAVIIAMVGGVLFGIYQMHTMDNYNDGLDFTTIKKGERMEDSDYYVHAVQRILNKWVKANNLMDQNYDSALRQKSRDERIRCRCQDSKKTCI